jgi:hypothetical protein
MAKPDEYLEQIKTIVGGDSFEYKVIGSAEAKSMLARNRTLEKKLRQVKRNINLDSSDG